MGTPRRDYTAKELRWLEAYADPRRRARALKALRAGGRTSKAIQNAACRRRLPSPSRRWTEGELAKLEEAVQDGWDEAKLAAVFRRPVHAVVARAAKLGIPTGTPQGCISIHQACLWSGYSRGTINRIIWRYHLTVRTILGTHPRRTARHNRYIERSELEIAVRKWMRALSLGDAACELGVDRHALSAELARLGVRRQAGGWRIEPEVAKAAAEAVKARRTKRSRDEDQGRTDL